MPDGKPNSHNHLQSVEITLGLLDAVEGGEHLSQRGIAGRLGVALGLTNALVKRCVKKGLLKISQAPAKRYAYYLTPKGFQEKSRLTAEYLSHSLNFFRHARAEYAVIFEMCARKGWKRIALYGASELGEIATLAATEAGIELVAVIDPVRNEHEFCSIPVMTSVEEAANPKPLDAVVLTSAETPHEDYARLVSQMQKDRILVPPMMRVSGAAREDESNAEYDGGEGGQ